MNNLITIEKGIPVTTTLAIAEGTENEHASVIKLVRAYLIDLERFGLCRFEIANSSFTAPGAEVERSNQGRPTEYAILNERQATLILSYMRNTD